MTTYSQGPWEVFQSGRDEAIYVASHKGNVVAFLGPEDEDENADLIAAAPELLEALTGLLREAEAFAIAIRPYAASESLAAARAAIKKAQGESN